MDLTFVHRTRKVLHPETCLHIDKYSHQSQYELLENYDGDVPDTVCPLCEREITEEPERYAPLASELATAAVHAKSREQKEVRYDALRHLITRVGDRLSEAGYLKSNVGVSVKSRGQWKKKRQSADDPSQFDRLVMDGLEVCLAFDVAYYNAIGYGSWDGLIEAGVNGEFGLSCEKNVAESIQWLAEKQSPTGKSTLDSLLESTELETQTDTPAEGPSESEPGQSEPGQSEPGSSASTAPTATSLSDF